MPQTTQLQSHVAEQIATELEDDPLIETTAVIERHGDAAVKAVCTDTVAKNRIEDRASEYPVWIQAETSY